MEDFCLDGREVPVVGRRLGSVSVTVLAQHSARSYFQVSSLLITGPKWSTGSRGFVEQVWLFFLSVCVQFKCQGLCVVRLSKHDLQCFSLRLPQSSRVCVRMRAGGRVGGWVNYPTQQRLRSHFRKGDCSRLCSRRSTLDFLCVPVFWVLLLAALLVPPPPPLVGD